MRESEEPPQAGEALRPGMLTSLLKEEIEKICPADREGKRWKELIVRATLQLAMKGNATALKEVWERIDGKILQTGKLQVDAEDKQITIKVVYGEDDDNDSHD